MYEYRVLAIDKVVDGDTMDCTIDLGFGLSARFRFRLAGCNAPEMTTPHGPAARQFAIAWFTRWSSEVAPADKKAPLLVARSHPAGPSTAGIGDGLYGRWLAYFVVHTPNGPDVANLTTELLAAGVDAVPLDPWTPAT